MPKTVTDIQAILRLGGGVSIDASKRTAIDLQGFARLANTSGAMLILRNADSKTSADLQAIARLAPGKVLFEL